MNLTPDVQLGQLLLPELPMLIEEAFAVLCRVPRAKPLDTMTIADLALEANLPLERVLTRLESIKAMMEDLEIDGPTLAARLRQERDSVFVLDVREPWEYDIGHIPDSRLMARTDLAQIFEGLKEFEVVTVCHHGARSLSAALYLKEAGLPRVRSLRGGLDLWAQEVDRNMPRY